MCTADVLVVATPTDLVTGGPGLEVMRAALARGLDVVCLDKGGLVRQGRQLHDLAARQGSRIRYSGAAAAALPTVDLIRWSMAGTGITRVAGVLNGTANYVLDAMKGGLDFPAALSEARDLGIAEPDPSADVDGRDTAAKLVLIANAAFGQWLDLDDVDVSGIADVTSAATTQAHRAGGALRLVGEASPAGTGISARVGVQFVACSHPFALARGSNKAIHISTETMGDLFAIGGGSDPRAAAASAIKDVINLFRADR